MKPRFLTILTMIFAAALSRLVPHPWNFTPVAAMALFAGANLDDFKMAVFIPLMALIVGDFFLGFHSTIPYVYGAFMLMVVIGRIFKEKKNIGTVAAGVVTSSIAFFLITNFGVWMIEGMYPKNLAGLFACFIAALPFFRMTLVGDLFFSAVMFGSFYALEKVVPTIRKQSLSIA